MTTDFLIIGNGIAGYSAAKTLRAKDKEAKITIVAKEDYVTYYRLKLTEAIANDDDEEDIVVSNDDWYDDNHIRLILGVEVTDYDFEKKQVVFDDENVITYDKLLLAIGSYSFVPPVENRYLRNITTIRTIDDVIHLRKDMADETDVAVIGGGVLGLEAAWSLQKKGKKVTVLQNSDYILPRQLDRASSELMMKTLEENGVRIALNANTKGFKGFNKVEGIILEDGSEIEAGYVVFSAGVRPNIALLKNKGIALDRGICVNTKLETSVPDVYAAGDCAQVGNTVMGLWTASNEQGRIAAMNMLGGDHSYDMPKQFTSLKLGPISVFSSGRVDDTSDVVTVEKENGAFEKNFFVEGVLVGGILYGDTKDMGRVNKAIELKARKEELFPEEG